MTIDLSGFGVKDIKDLIDFELEIRNFDAVPELLLELQQLQQVIESLKVLKL